MISAGLVGFLFSCCYSRSSRCLSKASQAGLMACSSLIQRMSWRSDMPSSRAALANVRGFLKAFKAVNVSMMVFLGLVLLMTGLPA